MPPTKPKATNRLPFGASALQVLAALALAAFILVGCGDEEKEGPPLPCSSAPIEQTGAIGELDGEFTAPEMSGHLDTTTISLDLGEVEYTPAGGTPELRPRIITFQTNVGSPSGRELLQALYDQFEESDGTFDIVSQDLETHCDVANGEICSRFGLDDTRNGKLINDAVIHQGLSGTMTVTKLTSTVVGVEWEVDFGPNLANTFDESSGTLTGCFDATYGQPNDNSYTLK